MAAAKALGLYWCASVDTFKAADIGDSMQVRLTDKPDGSLIVREGDSNEHEFILVIGSEGRYRVRGWLSGRDAKQRHWLKSYGNREPAYFVPQSDLKSLEALRALIVSGEVR